MSQWVIGPVITSPAVLKVRSTAIGIAAPLEAGRRPVCLGVAGLVDRDHLTPARTAHKNCCALAVDAGHLRFRAGPAMPMLVDALASPPAQANACADDLRHRGRSREYPARGQNRARRRARSIKIINRSASRTFHSVRCINPADGVSRKSGYRASRPGSLRKSSAQPPLGTSRHNPRPISMAASSAARSMPV